MKLKVIQTYQAVEIAFPAPLGRKMERHFSTDQARMAGIELELLPNNVVSIKTAADHILIPLANVAYMTPATEVTATADTSKERKSELKHSRSQA